MKKRYLNGLLVLLLAIVVTGCAVDPAYQKTQQGAGVGALLGAVSGAIIGYQADHSGGALRGALIGGAAGGALGAGVGSYMDKQQAAFENQLAGERAQHQIEIERQQNEILKLTLSSEVSFDFNSATLKPGFYGPLDKIAGIMVQYPQTRIVVAGHTDSVGSEQYNNDLSRRRAYAVVDYLGVRGVERMRMAAEGRGESQPIASNESEAGRAQNRRVEIYVVPNTNAGA